MQTGSVVHSGNAIVREGDDDLFDENDAGELDYDLLND